MENLLRIRLNERINYKETDTKSEKNVINVSIGSLIKIYIVNNDLNQCLMVKNEEEVEHGRLIDVKF